MDFYLSQIKISGTYLNRFKLLTRIVLIVLVIPHSNANQERLFSIVRKNKTDWRSSLKLYGILSSILSMKTHYLKAIIPCYRWKTDAALLEKLGSAPKLIMTTTSSKYSFCHEFVFRVIIVIPQLFFDSYFLIFYLQEALLFQVLMFIMNKFEVNV